MTLWELRALDVLAAILAVSGMTVIIRALLARHVSFAQRVAQGRVREEVPRDVTRWLRRAGASALDSLGSPRSRLHAGSTSPA